MAHSDYGIVYGSGIEMTQSLEYSRDVPDE